ncbi:MAG: hypothetical protein P8P74_05425 [Crocinitomicaceae bacterium]|nr:hypothetical protein [Crocinitomicaceae bacterium]
MTLRIISILFLLPFFANAQFKVEVVAINLDDQSTIQRVQSRLGGSGDKSHYGFNATQINTFDNKHLSDTLFVKHVNFKFEDQPLLDHDYTISGKKITVFVHGRP